MPFHVAAAAAEPAGASHQLTAARKKEKKEKEKQQLPICGLPASLLQQNQPEQTGNSPSPILLPPSFYPLWSSHLTALRFLQSSCSREGTGPKKKKNQAIYLSIYEGESHCRLPVTIFTSPLTTHRFPCYCTPLPLLARFLPFLLRLILKAQHSLYACAERKKVMEQERKEEERSS